MNKNRFALILLFLALILVFSINTTAENLKLHFIDVGQGDSILIEERGGKKILVDGGDRADRIAAEIINYLKDRKIEKLDYIISTHPHADHIGGLVDIIDSFEVENVLDSGKIHSSKSYENYLIKIDQENINFETPRQGDNLKIGESELIFLHPDQYLEDYNLNNSSLVFVLKSGGQKFLFTGDVEAEVERELLKENPELKVDLIKVPHHGSKTSSFKGWIKSLEPKSAIIQVGENHYGHPSPEIIEFYQNQRIQVFRNDLNGNIVVTADGENYTVKVDKNVENIKTDDKADPNTIENSKPNTTPKTAENLININSASAAILDQLWGIGPATAKKIINYRSNNGPFKQIQDIKKVDGIDDGKFDRWQDQITVQ